MQHIRAGRVPLGGVAVALLLVYLLTHGAAQTSAGRSAGRPAALPVGGTPACGPPPTRPWTTAQPLPTAVRLPAVASDGRYAYAAGGLGGGTDQFARYDPQTDTWQVLPSLPTPVTGATLLFAPTTGKLYLFGGSSGNMVGSSTQIYDPATASWSAGAALPAPRSVMSGGVWQGKLYLAAGADTLRFTPQVQLWAYDPLSDSWDTTLPALPGATMGAVGAVIADHLLIAGGADSNANPLSSLYDYDLTKRHWQIRAALPQAVYGAGGALPGAELWVIGGGIPFTAGGAPARPADRPQDVLGTTQLYDAAQDRWRSGPALTSPRALLGGTAVGTTVLAVGGFVNSADQVTVERTDALPGIPCPTITPPPTATGTPPTATATPSLTATPCGNWGSMDPWAISSTLPPPLVGVSVGSAGQYLYEAGGGNNTYPRGTSQVARYDPMSGTWLTRAPLLAASVYSAMTYAPNVGKLYYFGGINETTATTLALLRLIPSAAGRTAPALGYPYTQVYDPQTDHWTPGNSMPDWRGRSFFSVAYGNGKIYVPGGSYSNGFSPQRTLWAYDPLTDRWDSSLPPLPIPVMGAASGVINGHLYVAGGTQSSSSVLQTLFDYDIAARTWYTRTPLLQGAAFGESAVVGGRLWVGGGGTPYSGVARPAVVDTMQIYDPVTDSWSWGPALTGGRRLGAAAALGNQVFLYGGQDGSYNPVDSLEMTTYRPGLVCPRTTATATITPTAPDTAPPTATRPATGSATATGLPRTGTPTLTAGLSATATATPCTLQFSDVADPTAYYYASVYYLACRGVVSGYRDGTFQPFALTTRGQMTKIITLAFGLAAATPPAGGTFTDVAPANVFYGLIETAAAHGLVSGYTCGGSDPQSGAPEPCDGGRRPYFRPSANVTRGQVTKIVVGGAGWTPHPPPTPTFSDVSAGNVFYPFIETAVCHGIISGYGDGTFRPSAPAFRGQIAKISYLAVTGSATCAAVLPAP